MENKIIKGYKAFYYNMTNRIGLTFKEGKIYRVVGKLKFGNDGNGYHFCKNLEDTLRYFPARDQEIKLCCVTSYEDVVEYYDDYYGYYNMYAARCISIDKILSREEIINKMLRENSFSVQRFCSLFKLTNEEMEIFKKHFDSDIAVLRCIQFYQENDLDVYAIRKEEKVKTKSLKSINFDN